MKDMASGQILATALINVFDGKFKITQGGPQ